MSTRVLTVGLLFLLSPLPTSATECVRPGGASGCFASIDAAVDAASPGETVRVYPGKYFETVTIDTDGVELRGQGPVNRIIIDPDDPNTGPAITVNAKDVEIRGLTIRNGDSDGILVNPSGRRVLIEEVRVRGADGDCIDVQAPGAQIVDCNLVGCGSDGVQMGLFAPPGGNVVSGVSVTGTTVQGVASDGLDVTATNALLSENTISATREDCIRLFGNGADVTGNELSMCGGTGIDMLPEGDDGAAGTNGGDNAKIHDNVITQANDDCIGVRGHSADIRNNTMKLCREDGAIVEGDGAKIVENELHVVQSDCVQVRNGHNALVRDNLIEHCRLDGVDIDGNRARVVDNIITRLGGDGVDIIGDDAFVARNEVSELENNNDFSGRGPNGILVRGADSEVKNNVLENGAEGAAIWVHGPNPTVVGNTATAFRVKDFVFSPGACAGGPDEGRLCRVPPVNPNDFFPFPPEDPNAAGCGDPGVCMALDVKSLDNQDFSSGGLITVTCGNYAVLTLLDRGAGCGGGLVARNTVEGGVESNGFYIVHSNRDGAPDLVVEDNTAKQSSDDGFEIYGSGILLRGNDAIDNGDSQANTGDNGFLVIGTEIRSEGNVARDGVEDGFHFCGQIESIGDRAVDNAEDGIDIAGDQRDTSRYAAFDPQGENTELGGQPIESGNCPVPFDLTTVELSDGVARRNQAGGIEVSPTSDGSAVETSTAKRNRVDFCDLGTDTDTAGNDFDVVDSCVVD